MAKKHNKQKVNKEEVMENEKEVIEGECTVEDAEEKEQVDDEEVQEIKEEEKPGLWKRFTSNFTVKEKRRQLGKYCLVAAGSVAATLSGMYVFGSILEAKDAKRMIGLDEEISKAVADAIVPEITDTLSDSVTDATADTVVDALV